MHRARQDKQEGLKLFIIIRRRIRIITRSALGRAHLPPTTVFRRLKPRVAASTDPNTNTCMGFSRRNKISRCCVAVHTVWEKGIRFRFRYPDYDPDRAQKLISSSVSRHLSTRNISSKSMHTCLSTHKHRQTSQAIAYTSSVVGGK